MTGEMTDGSVLVVRPGVIALRRTAGGASVKAARAGTTVGALLPERAWPGA